jgi:hypothetical protein
LRFTSPLGVASSPRPPGLRGPGRAPADPRSETKGQTKYTAPEVRRPIPKDQSEDRQIRREPNAQYFQYGRHEGLTVLGSFRSMLPSRSHPLRDGFSRENISSCGGALRNLILLALPHLVGLGCGRRERSRRRPSAWDASASAMAQSWRSSIIARSSRSARSEADRLATTANLVRPFSVFRAISQAHRWFAANVWVPASAPTNRNACDLARVCRASIRRRDRRRANGCGRSRRCRCGARRLRRDIRYLAGQYQR